MVGAVTADLHAKRCNFGEARKVWRGFDRSSVAWRWSRSQQRMLAQASGANKHPWRTPHAQTGHAKMQQGTHHGLFYLVNIFFDKVTCTAKVNQGISHDLPGAVKRHLAASVGGNDGCCAR